MNTQPNTIELKGLTKRFPGVTAVDHLSFSVRPGEIFGLVGPDGAGKTTTLRMLAGVLPPDEGTAVVAGCDIVREPEQLKHFISYMPQRFGLYEDLTVAENIRFYADLFGVPRAARVERQARLLAAAGMSEFQHRLAGKLSGGMKQKLALACALIHRPKVLLLDEPTTGVDPISRRDFWRILYALLAEGVTILTSTAYLDEAERCHRLALLHEGRLLLCGTPAALKLRLPGVLLAVRSSEARRAREVLEGAEGVLNLLLVGDGVHVAADSAARAPQLELRLREAHISFTEVVPIAASIEDLFVLTVEQAAPRQEAPATNGAHP
jgi:ABC-2 type transport system ATP-binding protein